MSADFFAYRHLEFSTGDIAHQPDLQAVVNAANAELQTGGGVAGALHRAAGPELARAGRPFAPIRPGQAVITPAFNLPNDHVIHVLGPVYGRDEPADALLKSCFREALYLAREKGIKSLGFPAISTGAFGYPLEDAAKVSLQAIRAHWPECPNVEQVRLVLYSENDRAVFEDTWQNLNS